MNASESILEQERIAVDLRTASRMCGLSVQTLRDKIRIKELPRVKVGRKVLVFVEDLRRFLEARRA